MNNFTTQLNELLQTNNFNRDFNTSYGVLKIKMPRDRNNEFQPPLVQKYNHKNNTTAETILKLF